MEYFLKQNELFELTGLKQNTNINDIKHLVPMANDTVIRDILGREFLNHMLNVYNTNSANPEEEVLIDYIKKALAMQVRALAIYELSFPLENKGIIRKNGQNISEADDIATMRRYSIAEQQAQVYLRNLEDYLYDNHKDYPIFNEHISQSCLCGRIGKSTHKTLNIRGF